MKITALTLALFLLSVPVCGQSLPATGAEITEYLRGYARMQMEYYPARCYGSAVLQTWRWTDGREAVRVVLYQDQQEIRVSKLADGQYSVTFAARADGSVLMRIASWGTVELFSADPVHRASFASVAPSTETTVQSIKWSYLRDSSLEIWIE